MCESASRVLETVRYPDHVERVRRCREEGHVFTTAERPHQSDPPDGWGLGGVQTLNTRNLYDRTLRERVMPCGQTFKTLERSVYPSGQRAAA